VKLVRQFVIRSTDRIVAARLDWKPGPRIGAEHAAFGKCSLEAADLGISSNDGAPIYEARLSVVDGPVVIRGVAGSLDDAKTMSVGLARMAIAELRNTADALEAGLSDKGDGR
jgi:hypothetical protein